MVELPPGSGDGSDLALEDFRSGRGVYNSKLLWDGLIRKDYRGLDVRRCKSKLVYADIRPIYRGWRKCDADGRG